MRVSRLRTSLPPPSSPQHATRQSRASSQPPSDRDSSEGPEAHAGRHWRPDASILIVGLRGTGKTSLAILASASFGFGVVDADQHFYQTTALSRGAYVSKYGFERYREEELALIQKLLREYPTRRIIVGGPGFAESMCRSLLETFIVEHPVIFVMRDPGEVDQALGIHDVAKISHLFDLSSPLYRSLSSFEFYNLSEPVANTEVAGAPRHHPFLALKHAEDDFVRLIHGIRSRKPCPHTLRAHHSLDFLPPESKRYSYALTLPIAAITDIATELPRADFLVDAVQIVLDLDHLLKRQRHHLDQATATYITRQYYVLRRHVKLPVIVHVDMNPPSSRYPSPVQSKDWSVYMEVMTHVLRLAPEYITLDLNCETGFAQEILSKRGFTKVIGHFFDPTTDPSAWEGSDRLELVQRAEDWGCNLVRICQQSACPDDNTAVQEFKFELQRRGLSRVPVIAYNTGRPGRGSCLVNPILTPVTHDIIRAAVHQEAAGGDHDDGLLTVQEAQQALYASFAFDGLMFGVFGSAGASSMTPMMHNAAFKVYGMPHEFQLFSATTLDEMEGIVRDPRFGGATVRFPFKQAIMSAVDHVSPEAQAIGAVNTLVPLRRPGLDSLILDCNRGGPVLGLFGDNTDWIGIYTSVRRNLSPLNAVKSRTSALIIGAGGMARAAIYAALRLQVENIFIQNRTLANAERLVQHFDDKTFPVHNIGLRGASPSMIPPDGPTGDFGTHSPNPPRAGPARVRTISSLSDPWPAGADLPTIIISCIPLLTRDGPALTDITLSEAWLASPTGGVVIDLAYNMANTPLLRQMRSLQQKGWVTVSGLQVLPEQGFAQFELFTGRKAPQHLMRSKLEEYIRTQSQ